MKARRKVYVSARERRHQAETRIGWALISAVGAIFAAMVYVGMLMEK